MYARLVKARAARKAVLEADVVATRLLPGRPAKAAWLLCRPLVVKTLVVMPLFVMPAVGATLPEDRADVMYHRYKGGGLTVDGPSVLVRQSMLDKVSVWGNYYVDMVTSASVDVMTTASPYEERRQEWSAGSDFVFDDTSMGLSFTKSDENDYTARTARFSTVSQPRE